MVVRQIAPAPQHDPDRPAQVPAAGQVVHDAVEQHAAAGRDQDLVRPVERTRPGQRPGQPADLRQQAVDRLVGLRVDALEALDAHEAQRPAGAHRGRHPEPLLVRAAPGPALGQAHLDQHRKPPAGARQPALHQRHAALRVDQAAQPRR